MRRVTSLLCVLVASTSLLSPAVAEQLAEKPLPAPARPKTDRTAALEQRVRDLEARLVVVEAELRRVQQAGTQPPPPRSSEPDPSKTYAIPLDNSPAIGPRVAPVTLVAYVQFPEAWTAKAWPTLQQLRAEYKGQLRMVFKVFVVHPKTERSSVAVCAAGAQGQLDRMADAVLTAAQTPEKGEALLGYRELPADELRELARSLRLDLKQYDRDLAACQAGLARDHALMSARGQRGVPVFWINGRPLSGARSLEGFRMVIDEELAKARTDQARGGKPGDYYERLMKTAATAP